MNDAPSARSAEGARTDKIENPSRGHRERSEWCPGPSARSAEGARTDKSNKRPGPISLRRERAAEKIRRRTLAARAESEPLVHWILGEQILEP